MAPTDNFLKSLGLPLTVFPATHFDFTQAGRRVLIVDRWGRVRVSGLHVSGVTER